MGVIPPSDTFNVTNYIRTNAVNLGASGNSCKEALTHYAKYGKSQGLLTVDPAQANSFRVSILSNPQAKDFSLDKYELVFWRLGSNAHTKLDSRIDTSRITGLPNAFSGGNFLFGPSQNTIEGETGFTGVQMYAGQFGIGIDSRTVKELQQSSSQSDLFTIVLQKQLSKPWQPWKQGNSIRMAMDIRVPFAGGKNGGGGMMVSYFYVKDQKSKKGFWLGAPIYDVRAAEVSFQDRVVRDDCIDCTQSVIFLAGLKRGSPYITLAANSSESTSNVFSETKRFDIEFTEKNLANILRKLREKNPEFSADPKNYVVTSWNLNPEVWANEQSDGWIGLSGKIIQIGPKNQ